MVKRLVDEDTADRRYLARTDPAVIEAMEAKLRAEGGLDPELAAKLDRRDAARGRVKNRKKKPPAE